MGNAPHRRLRADLHVHTRHSLLHAMPVLGARDCYSDPEEVYRVARARQMDLVTFTDHDTVDGCLELLDRKGDLPDFFMSEEVGTEDLRTGLHLHVSVFGIDEKTHRQIQYLKADVRDLLKYLGSEGIPATLNHVGSSIIGRRPGSEALLDLLSEFPLIETRNGAERAPSNRLAARLAGRLAERGVRMGRTGGSDAHTLRRIGWAWTEARADDRESFLGALRTGRVRAAGVSGRLGPIIRDVYRVVLSYYADVALNDRRHLTPEGRRRALACAAASLPLHLLLLPAAGTAFRDLRIRRTVRLTMKEFSSCPVAERSKAENSRGEGRGSRLPETGMAGPVGLAWLAGAGSEEA